MTVSEINTHARRKYNAIGSSFFSDAEIYDFIYEGCLEMVNNGLNVERLFSTSTVVGQLQYSFPTNVIAIKRVVYNGAKLSPINMREDDLVTASNENVTTQGTPKYYFTWNETLNLRPIPDAVNDLEIYAFVEPQPITSASALEIPSQWHMSLVDFVVSEMCAKDKNLSQAAYYLSKWERAVQKALAHQAKKRHKDEFAMVQHDEFIE